MTPEDTLSTDISSTDPKGNGSGARSTLDEIKSKIGEIAEPVKEKAEEVAKDRIVAGTDQLRVLATAVHGAASSLESEMPKFATYVHEAGKKLEGAASNINDRNLEELLDDFDGFARQQPALVFGAATLAGFALARFLKSSGMPQSTQETNIQGTGLPKTPTDAY